MEQRRRVRTETGRETAQRKRKLSVRTEREGISGRRNRTIEKTSVRTERKDKRK